MSSISAGTTTTTGYVVTSDTTGALVLKTGASGTTAVTIGSDQSVTFAGSQTFSGGTANGVLYLNGSKVATSGSALTFDGTNLGVGVSPASDGAIHVHRAGASFPTIKITNGTTGTGNLDGFDLICGSGGEAYVYNRENQPILFGVNNAEQMRLTSTGLGIGTSSPQSTYKLTLSGTDSVFPAVYLDNTTNSKAYSMRVTGTSWIIRDNTAGTDRLNLDSSGNLGLGVTPSAWGNSIRAIEGYSTSGSWSIASGGGLGSALNIQSNTYYNGSDWIYKDTNLAANYYQNAGTHNWRIAASGTGGTAVSWTQAMTLNASGNLGVGVTSPATRLEVNGVSEGEYFRAGGGTISARSLQFSSFTVSGLAGVGHQINVPNANGVLTFAIGSTERARIDSSGNLGIGTTSPIARLHVNSTASALVGRFDTTQSGGAIVGFYQSGGPNGYVGANGPWLGTAATDMMMAAENGKAVVFYTNGSATERARITSGGNVGIGMSTPQYRLSLGNTIGRKLAIYDDGSSGGVAAGFGTDLSGSAYELSSWAGSPGGGNGVFTWGQVNTTNGAFTERMRIDTAGRLLLGATSSYTDYATIQVTGDNKGVAIRDTTDGAYRAIYNQSGTLYFYNGSNEGYLSSGGAWVNASDARLKSNIRNIEYGLSTVLATQPRHFERTDVEGTYIGFIAQELQSIIPEVVSGSEKQLGVDYGSLVALAFKAIQEQQALIESLTQRIAALEGQ